MILLSFGCEETGRGKTAAFKMKTPRSYSEVPRWKLDLPRYGFKPPRWSNMLALVFEEFFDSFGGEDLTAQIKDLLVVLFYRQAYLL